MASTIIMQRCSPDFLEPVDALGLEALGKLPYQKPLSVTIAPARNVKFLRKFWTLMMIVFRAQQTYATKEDMVDAIKIGVGHFKIIQRLDGTEGVIPLSISFAKMTEKSFGEFYDRVVDLILTKILPNVARADLEDQVLTLLGSFLPSDIR